MEDAKDSYFFVEQNFKKIRTTFCVITLSHKILLKGYHASFCKMTNQVFVHDAFSDHDKLVFNILLVRREEDYVIGIFISL